jgi:methylated-DNA-[protein]-cysteine S-methyltransferase
LPHLSVVPMMHAMSLVTARIASPIGMITLCANRDELVSTAIDTQSAPEVDAGTHPILGLVSTQMREWFVGQRRSFTVPLKPLASPRGNELRGAIAAIPYGTTLTYGQLAQLANSAPRAIGQACMRNQLPILVPCHRVTSSGAKEYYSGGDGPATKAWLIAFEQGRAYRYGSDRLL